MTHILEERRNGYVYRVFADMDADISEWDFENPKQVLKMQKKIDNGSLSFYGVVKLATCPTCESCTDTEEESLWGILSESPRAALDEFIRQGN